MIEYYFKTSKDDNYVSLASPKEGCWIHIDEAITTDLDQLCTLTGLEYTEVQDSLDKYEIPRIEKVRSNTLIFTRHPIELDLPFGLYTATLTFILTPDYFITISPQKNTLIRNFLTKKNPFSTLERSTLLLQLMLRVTQDFMSHIRKVRHNVMTQEKEMINVESDEIAILTRHEEILNQYQYTLEPTHTVFEEFHSERYSNLHAKEREILEDLLLAVKQSESLCAIALKSIRSLRDSYQIIFTNNLHKTIKLLTGLTIILNIPTMIASIYGMNVDLPFSQNTHAFTLILSSILIFSILGLMIFRRVRWL